MEACILESWNSSI